MEGPAASQAITANALLALEALSSPELRAACGSAEVVLPESSGMAWALGILGQPRSFQITGVDLAFRLCQRASEKDFSVSFIGGAPGVAAAAAAALRKRIPGLRIGSIHHGFFNSDENTLVITKIKEGGARLTLLAMGMPRQDVWIHQNRGALPAGLYMGVGGAFDIWAGNLKRAPVWVQKRGIEWFYRLCQEPWRARRIAKLPLFALKVLLQKCDTIRPR